MRKEPRRWSRSPAYQGDNSGQSTTGISFSSSKQLYPFLAKVDVAEERGVLCFKAHVISALSGSLIDPFLI